MLKIKGGKKFETAEEIQSELLDRLQKYPAEAKAVYENHSLSRAEKIKAIDRITNQFCGLSEFLNITLGLDVRLEDGQLFHAVSFQQTALYGESA